MIGRRSQRDFEDEIQSHLELEVERLRAQGMSPEEATRLARRNFGNIGMAEDRFYHASRFSSLQNIGRDLRHAWRGLRRTPAFFATCVLTLALAIGAVTGMFSVVNAVILRSLPFPAADRLVSIAGTAPGSDLPQRFGLGIEFYLQYKERSKLLDGVFIFSGGTSTFRTADRVERIPMAWVSNDMYSTLGVQPIAGRLPRSEDGNNGVVISDQLWNNWFGRDRGILGKWFFVSDTMKQIVGVMPAGMPIPGEETMLWISREVHPGEQPVGQFGGAMVGRMKPGVTRDQLVAELTRLSKEIPARFGGSPAFARVIEQHRALAEPLRDTLVGGTTTRSLWVLLGSVAVVLLIACANVANLFMVRSEGRTRDLAIRRAIGASRAQLVRLQMSEALLVAIAAGALAITLSRATLPLFVQAAPDGIPGLRSAGLDAVTMLTTLGIVGLVALFCGIAPAVRASAPELTRLREGGRGSTGQRRWGRDTLVVAQTALALVLVISSALLVESFRKLSSVDPGYDTKDLYTFQYAPDQPQLHDGPSYGQLHLTMMERLRALPGVSGVGIVNNIPLDEGTPSARVRTDDKDGGDGGTLVSFNFTGGDYFKVMGISVLEGRTFSNDEAVKPNSNVIVSRSAAEKLWPGRDALGRIVRPRFGRQDSLSFTVVGVVEDVKQDDWRDAGEAVLYFPLTGPAPGVWGMSSPAYVVKSARAGSLQGEVRQLVHQMAPEAPVYREFTMEFLARRSMIGLSFTMLTLGVVAALALLLGAIGLYGVLSYVVAERTREIGVRMALGATSGAVRRMVVSQGARVVLIGVIIGIAGAVAGTRSLNALLYGVKAVDPLVFAAMALVMLGVGVLASYVPAHRASSVNPIESLRSD